MYLCQQNVGQRKILLPFEISVLWFWTTAETTQTSQISRSIRITGSYVWQNFNSHWSSSHKTNLNAAKCLIFSNWQKKDSGVFQNRASLKPYTVDMREPIILCNSELQNYNVLYTLKSLTFNSVLCMFLFFFFLLCSLPFSRALIPFDAFNPKWSPSSLPKQGIWQMILYLNEA